MINATDIPSSPWKVFNAGHVLSATATVLGYLVNVLRNHIGGLGTPSATAVSLPKRVLPSFDRTPDLKSIDLTGRLKKSAYRQLLARHQSRISELHHEIHKLHIHPW